MNAAMDRPDTQTDEANAKVTSKSHELAINLRATVEAANDYMNDSDNNSCTSDRQQQQIGANVRGGSGLRRQPTKYPHGLGISVVQTASDEDKNYSRASTLRSSWDGNSNTISTNITNDNNSNHNSCDSSQQSASCHRKYRISMISNPESLAELQVRRYKYPLTGNYYLDTQEATTIKPPTPAPLVLLSHFRRYCRWKYLRWPLIFTASVLLFFGLITYCIWLHDVSVARERYLQRRQQLSATTAENEASSEYTADSVELQQPTTTTTTITIGTSMTTTTTEHTHALQESTILRAISARTRQRPKQQKLTTVDYAATKGAVESDKEQKDSTKDLSTAPETTTYASAEAALVPANVLPFSGYNGHQNNFGVPIEEDERILRLINGLFPINTPATSTSTPIAKVSPTIPPVPPRARPTSAMTAASRTTAQEHGCYSTSLPMCQGVLDYDLTYNSTTKLEASEREAYQKLIDSNCSTRAVEFICAALEPECRPRHIGVLPPCRRICKAILEACSIIIANWDVLNEIFDCSLYPDSNDPHRCEDPTRRRGYCYENEFECYDRTCIPQQWQCDNIKDCASGEDEDSCLICEQQDEFRCRSNEKCVPDSVRCDLKHDCFDGSDEEDCEEYGSGEETADAFDEAALNSFPRVFSYASFLSPNQSNEGLYTYITATTDDETGTKFQVHEITNRTSGVSHEEVTNIVPGEGPKGFVNFRDSKEIMMTSDSENKFKYSAAAAAAARAANRTTNKFSSNTTPLKPAASMRVAYTTPAPRRSMAAPLPATCAAHQLRCVSGKCITVDQLCDKKIDCPDGADEVMCVYKERSTTTRSGVVAVAAALTTSTQRTDKRTVRTTIKRKVKT